MRSLEEIRKEAEDECLKNNCQSWPVICLVAMQKAIKEFSREAQDKLDDMANV
jgi:hypothetical protein